MFKKKFIIMISIITLTCAFLISLLFIFSNKDDAISLSGSKKTIAQNNLSSDYLNEIGSLTESTEPKDHLEVIEISSDAIKSAWELMFNDTYQITDEEKSEAIEVHIKAKRDINNSIGYILDSPEQFEYFNSLRNYIEEFQSGEYGEVISKENMALYFALKSVLSSN